MNSTETTHIKGGMALFGAAFIYATFGVLIREVSKMLGTAAQVSIRFGLAAIILFVVLKLIKKNFSLTKRQLRNAVLMGIGFAGVVLLFTIAVNTTTLANSVFLLYGTSITSSLLIGTFLFHEKLNIVKILAIALAFLGIATYSGAILTLSLGVLAGLGAGLFDGVSNALRKTMAGVDRNVVVMYSNTIGAVVAALFIPFAKGDIIRQVSTGSVVALIIFTVLIVVIGNLLLYGFQHFDVNVGTIILSMELLFTVVLGYIFFRELPRAHELLGGLCIFAASFITIIEPRRVAAFFRRCTV